MGKDTVVILGNQNMGKMNIVLNDKLEERFRRTVFECKGMKKGNISEAVEEAIEKWIDSCEILKTQGEKKTAKRKFK